MLPKSSLPSLAEKISAHRDREEHCALDEAAEAEKSASFGLVRKRRKKKTFSDLLLGAEFETACDDLGIGVEKEDLALPDAEKTAQESPKENVANATAVRDAVSVAVSAEKDWTIKEIDPSLMLKLNAADAISVSIARPQGGEHNVVLSSLCLRRLRGVQASSGHDAVTEVTWLDDNVIDGFMSLLNSRSEQSCKFSKSLHKPSKNKDLFNRGPVRTVVFSTQFFTIWSRKTNGGYENIRRWRRKISGVQLCGNVHVSCSGQ